MKKIFSLILILFYVGHCCPSQGAETSSPKMKTTLPSISLAPPSVPSAIPPIQPQPVNFSNCSKNFKFDSQKLFYLTLAAINANRFNIDEIQSKSGYVLFTVGQKQFLAIVISIDSKTSMLKITPCDDIYYFPIGIVQNMFKYIELNVNTSIEKLSIL